jgi:hypothetical protein
MRCRHARLREFVVSARAAKAERVRPYSGAWMGALLVVPLGLAGCSSVMFGNVPEPNFAPVGTAVSQVTAPTPPVAEKVPQPVTPTAWSVVDLTAKAPLRKKLTAVRVTLNKNGPGGAPQVQANSGLLTASLLTRLMAAGFTSVQDLSSAPRVAAEVERTGTGGRVVLRGTLADVVPVAAPLRAEHVLTVRFVVLPAASKSQATRFAISEEVLAAYDAGQKHYVATVTAAIAQLDAVYGEYANAFNAARAQYDRKGGGYSSFPTKSTGQQALERHQALEKKYQELRAALQARRQRLPVMESVRAAAEARVETTATVRERVVAVATLQEQGSNRVLWLGESDSTAESGETAVVALLDDLPNRFPTEKRGAR